MELGDVIDQLHDDNGLAYSGAAECSHLATLEEGTNQVNHLDASGKNLGRGRLLYQRRRWTMDRIVLVGFDGATVIHRISCDVEHPAHNTFANGNRDGCATVVDLKSAFQALSPRHGDGPHPLVTQMLLHFEGDLCGLILNLVLDRQGVINRR